MKIIFLIICVRNIQYILQQKNIKYIVVNKYLINKEIRSLNKKDK